MMHVNHSPSQSFQAVLSALNGYIRNNSKKIILDISNRQQNIKYIAKLIYKYFNIPNEQIDAILAGIVNDNTTHLLPSLEDLNIKQNDKDVDPTVLITTIAKINHYLQTISTGMRKKSVLREKINTALAGHEQMTTVYAQRTAFKSQLFSRLPSDDLKQLSRTSSWYQEAIAGDDHLWKRRAQHQLAIMSERFKMPQESYMHTFFRLAAANKFYANITLYTGFRYFIDENFVKEALSAFSVVYRLNDFLSRSINSIKSFMVYIGDDKYSFFNTLNRDTKQTYSCISMKVCIKKHENGQFILMPEKAEKIEIWDSTQPNKTKVLPIQYQEDKREFDLQPTLKYSAGY